MDELNNVNAIEVGELEEGQDAVIMNADNFCELVENQGNNHRVRDFLIGGAAGVAVTGLGVFVWNKWIKNSNVGAGIMGFRQGIADRKAEKKAAKATKVQAEVVADNIRANN